MAKRPRQLAHFLFTWLNLLCEFSFVTGKRWRTMAANSQCQVIKGRNFPKDYGCAGACCSIWRTRTHTTKDTHLAARSRAIADSNLALRSNLFMRIMQSSLQAYKSIFIYIYILHFKKDSLLIYINANSPLIFDGLLQGGIKGQRPLLLRQLQLCGQQQTHLRCHFSPFGGKLFLLGRKKEVEEL